MGIISIEQADRLYWLGRYTERVYTTLKMYARSYDQLIDGSQDIYIKYCKDIDIPNLYNDKEDFVNRYPFDPSISDSIISNLTRAYDNAIELRESIGSESLAYIQLAIYAMNKAANSKAPLIELQKVIDNLLAFYGIADDQIDSKNVRNIIKAGKRIERVDLYARLGLDKNKLTREVHRMIPRLEKSGLEYNIENVNKIVVLLEQDPLDYYTIVSNVESIF